LPPVGRWAPLASTSLFFSFFCSSGEMGTPCFQVFVLFYLASSGEMGTPCLCIISLL
jgi:hypothetical protein